MFNFFNNNKGDEVMARAKLSKTAKVRNLFAKGSDVSWKQLRNTYDLKSVSYTHLTLPTTAYV